MTDPYDFFKRSEAMMAFYSEGRYLDALNVTEQLAVEFPEEAATTSFWRVCLLSRAGKTDEALRAMSAAMEDGLWWSERQLRTDDDLAPLQGLSAFETMVVECRMRHAAAQQDAKPDILIRLPSAPAPYPLLIALHARTSSPARDFRNWEPILKMGWMIAMPQSSQLGTPNSYVWDDTQTAFAEVANHYRKLTDEQPIDAKRAVLAGFSQGGALAIQLCLQKIIPSRGFLSIVPGRIAAEGLDELIASARGQRGVIVTGGRDPRHQTHTQIHALLNENGIPCEMEVHPELGHELPPNFERTIAKAIDFIFKESE